MKDESSAAEDHEGKARVRPIPGSRQERHAIPVIEPRGGVLLVDGVLRAGVRALCLIKSRW